MIQEVLYEMNVRDFHRFRSAGDGEVHVSSLVVCPLKWFYAKKYPDIAVAQQFQGYLILGKLVHLGLQRVLEKPGLIHGAKRVLFEVEAEKKVSVEHRGLTLIYTIKGRADMLVETISGERIVVEVKTAKGDYGIPHKHHELQLRIYMNMLSAEKGVLLYITPDRVTEYHVTGPLGDLELKSLIKGFLDRKGPAWDWECLRCPYNILCPSKVQNNRRR